MTFRCKECDGIMYEEDVPEVYHCWMCKRAVKADTNAMVAFQPSFPEDSVASHGLSRKDKMAANAYQPEEMPEFGQP